MQIFNAKTLTVSELLPGSPKIKSLWIRTAAGPETGFGHLKRCLILAQALQDCCAPLFLVDREDCWSAKQLSEGGWSYYNGKLGEIWSLMPDPACILIDTRLSAGLGDLIRTAKSRGIPVISIHDLGLNPLLTDITIDGSIAPPICDSPLRNSEHFSGTQFMVLDPLLGRFHQQRKKIPKRIRSVFINLGGGNSKKFFEKVLEGMKLWTHSAELIGVPGFIDWGQENLCGKALPRNFRWESRNIERLLFQADLAITAGGLSAYEALCCGTPLLALSYDRLQQITITELAARGACIDLGSGDDLDPSRLSETLSMIDSDAQGRKRLSALGRQMVDGRGAERVSGIVRQSLCHSAEFNCWRSWDVSGACV